MKKILVLFIGCIIITGCNNKKENEKELFMNVDWINGEEHIYFGNDGHFSYYDSSGSPVDDYDLCDSYVYNKNEKVIKLNCDKSVKNTSVEVISYSSDKIVLNINNKKIEFRKSEE